MKRLYIIDSTTIRLFKAILKGVGRNPLNGKKKGGIKAHTLINADENVPQLVRYTSAARHDKLFLKEIKFDYQELKSNFKLNLFFIGQQ